MENDIKQQILTGERALFQSRGLTIEDTVFDKGESPLKESRDIGLSRCMFRWKYPLWYCRDVRVRDSIWFEMARAGMWYTDDISVEDSSIEAPKGFRRCKGVSLRNVTFSNAAETLWQCREVNLENVRAVKGDYFAMNTRDIRVSGLELFGNYSFDGAENVTMENSRLLTKDAFWNSVNVTVRDSFISGEYLGWNSRNLTLENCTIESLQGLCYVDNLVMRNCRLIDTTLAFEYSSVDAEITSRVESILNPGSGTIRADSIGELIIEKDRVDPELTHIFCGDIGLRSDRPEWLRDRQ